MDNEKSPFGCGFCFGGGKLIMIVIMICIEVSNDILRTVCGDADGGEAVVIITRQSGEIEDENGLGM